MSLTKADASILEIGFNSGHSATMFLTLFPLATVTSFDLCQHVYTEPAIRKLVGLFGDRLSVHCGNSHTTLPEFRKNWVEKYSKGGGVGEVERENRFDAVFIDAGHYYEDTWLDLLFSVPMFRKGTTVIVDDCTTNVFEMKGVQRNKNLADFNVYEMHVSLAWRHAVALKIIEPLQGDVCGDCDLCIGKLLWDVEAHKDEEINPFFFAAIEH